MEKEAPMPLSRLMLYCAECGRGVRVRTRRLEDGSEDAGLPEVRDSSRAEVRNDR